MPSEVGMSLVLERGVVGQPLDIVRDALGPPG